MTEDQKALILETIDLMSRLFWGVDSQFSRTLWDGGLTGFFSELNALLNGDIAPQIKAIKRSIERFDSADDLHSDLNTSYVTLFVNAKEGLQVPLYESSYLPGGSGLMGAASITMKELYARQGLSLAESHNEPADHLSVELEYLYFVLQKGWEEGDEASLAEASRFVNNVLQSWFREFEKRLSKADSHSIYAPFAGILKSVLIQLAKRRWIETESN